MQAFRNFWVNSEYSYGFPIYRTVSLYQKLEFHFPYHYIPIVLNGLILSSPLFHLIQNHKAKSLYLLSFLPRS